jgi:hypothetical protein
MLHENKAALVIGCIAVHTDARLFSQLRRMNGFELITCI